MRVRRSPIPLLLWIGMAAPLGCTPDPKEVVEDNRSWAIPKLKAIHRACLDARSRDRVPVLKPVSLELKRHTGFLHFFQERPNLKILGVEFCAPRRAELPSWADVLVSDTYDLERLADAFGVNVTGTKPRYETPLYFTSLYRTQFPLDLEVLEPIEYIAFYRVTDFAKASYDAKAKKVYKGFVGGQIFVYALGDGKLVKAAKFEARSGDRITVGTERFVTVSRKVEGQPGHDSEEVYDLGDYEQRANSAVSLDFFSHASKALKKAIGHRPTGDRW